MIQQLSLKVISLHSNHVRIILLVISLALFVLGAGAPESGGNPGG